MLDAVTARPYQSSAGGSRYKTPFPDKNNRRISASVLRRGSIGINVDGFSYGIPSFTALCNTLCNELENNSMLDSG